MVSSFQLSMFKRGKYLVYQVLFIPISYSITTTIIISNDNPILKQNKSNNSTSIKNLDISVISTKIKNLLEWELSTLKKKYTQVIFMKDR